MRKNLGVQVIENNIKFIVVEERSNPSTDYFIEPWFIEEGLDWQCFSLQKTPPVLNINQKISVIFVRYINPSWRRWIEKNSPQIEDVIFFMDDDVFDWQAYKVLPSHYRYKLFKLSLRHKNWLQKNADLWVSSPFLADKYSDWKPEIIKPRSPYISQQAITVFYHGSASHRDEIRWLFSVIKSVLDKDSSICFELIGDRQVQDMFASLSRVHVTHPMKWPAYKAFISRPGRMIGLAPLLDNPFNRSRSATKFYDITHAGAVGIYADHPVYRSMIHSGENGLLLKMQKELWIEAILKLANDEKLRGYLMDGARNTA